MIGAKKTREKNYTKAVGGGEVLRVTYINENIRLKTLSWFIK